MSLELKGREMETMEITSHGVVYRLERNQAHQEVGRCTLARLCAEVRGS